MAIRFDADGDQYSRTTSLPGITAFTLMGWFKITDRNAYSTFFSYGANGIQAYTIQTNATGTALVLWDGDSEVSLGLSVTAATWAHVAMSVSGTSGSNFLGYVNGVVGTAQLARTWSGTSLLVGESHGGAEWLNAACASLKFYGAVLTAAEIQQEMGQYLPVRTANLNGFYPLLALADDEIDFSGNGNTLTPGGTLATEDGPPIPWKSSRRRANYVPAVGGGPAFLARMNRPVLQAVNRAGTY